MEIVRLPNLNTPYPIEAVGNVALIEDADWLVFIRHPNEYNFIASSSDNFSPKKIVAHIEQLEKDKHALQSVNALLSDTLEKHDEQKPLEPSAVMTMLNSGVQADDMVKLRQSGLL